MNKKWIGSFASVCALTMLASTAIGTRSQSLVANADEAATVYTQTFETDDTAALLDTFEIAKENEATTVDIVNIGEGDEVDNALQVQTVTGAAEIKLPVNAKDFVMEFDCKRTSETNVRDTAVGLKYRAVEEGEESYEIRIHSAQRDLASENISKEWSNSHYTSFYENEQTGHGMENWHITESDVASGVNDGKMQQFNYYYHELYLDEWYNFRLQVSGDYIELFINGERFMKDILEHEGGTGLFLRMDSETTACTALFDNIRVYDPAVYAEKMIGELPTIEAGQTQEVVDGYVQALENVRKYVINYLGGDTSAVSNYAEYTQKTEALESTYKIAASQTPVLNVAWKDAAYETESRVKLPAATAVDWKGNALAVDIKVHFDGKTVKSEAGAFTANEAGEYEIVYVARDAKGNETTETHTLTVTKKEKTVVTKEVEKKEPDFVLFAISAGVLVAGIAAGVVLFVLGRKKR